MWLEPGHLARLITAETGLPFEATTGVDGERQRWYLLQPQGLLADHTFGIRTTLGWRRLRSTFEPGKFAGQLIADMAAADETGKAVFRAVLADCRELGAKIDFEVNGSPFSFESDEAWSENWNRFFLSLNKGQLDLGTEDGEPDPDIVCRWTGRFAAAITAILPLEDEEPAIEEGMIGYPEGAINTLQVNRYERDRRNRAAAISIYGARCLACGIDFGDVYGEVATGFIEVHHTTPISRLGPEYVIDPARDLIPLCSNCHAVAHRRNPPFSFEEIRGFLNRSSGLH